MGQAKPCPISLGECREAIKLLGGKKLANQVKSDKDYSQYFQPPSLTDAKKRGKEEIAVHYDFTIPEDMQEFGNR